VQVKRLAHCRSYRSNQYRYLAGMNAVLSLKKRRLFSPPPDTAFGDFVHVVNKHMEKRNAIADIFTFSGSIYFERMKNSDFTELREKKFVNILEALV